MKIIFLAPTGAQEVGLCVCECLSVYDFCELFIQDLSKLSLPSFLKQIENFKCLKSSTALGLSHGTIRIQVS